MPDQNTELALLTTRIDALESQIKAQALKDEVINHLKEANTALLDQLKNRWSFFQMMVSVVGLFFAINFGYQLYKSEGLKQLETSVVADRTRLANQTARLNQAMEQQASIIADLARAAGYLNAGYRDFQRKRYPVTADTAKMAVDLLTTDLGAVRSTASGDKGSLQPITSLHRRGQPDITTESLTAPLQGAVREMLFSAYELYARAHYFLHDTDDLIEVQQSANTLIQLDPLRWEGYHFKGLAIYESEYSPLHPERVKKDAVAPLTESVTKNPRNNIDWINLAELFFVNKQWDASRRNADEFNKHSQKMNQEFRTMYLFFTTMSAYMLGDLSAEGGYDGFVQKVHREKLVPNFSGTYTFDVLEQFRRTLLADKSTDHGKLVQVARAIQWLTEQKKD